METVQDLIVGCWYCKTKKQVREIGYIYERMPIIEDAIAADGRGHFLSGYDGNEVEQGDYFIYRIN